MKNIFYALCMCLWLGTKYGYAQTTSGIIELDEVVLTDMALHHFSENQQVQQFQILY
jgi:hypothetical protein